MRVHFYSAVESDDGKHLGAWYSDIERSMFVQVPRVGDTVWIETDETKLTRFVVVEVQWEFKARKIGNEKYPMPSTGAEVYLLPEPQSSSK